MLIKGGHITEAMKKMRAIGWALAVMIMVFPALVLAKGLEVVKQSGGYTGTFAFDKNPPVAGNNRLDIAITDSAGAKVTDAKVRVEYSMPAMPGMPAMSYKSDAAPTAAGYSATLDLSMAGPWDITVKIARGGKVTSFKFNIDAR